MCCDNMFASQNPAYFSLAFDHILDIQALVWWDVDISLLLRCLRSSFTNPRKVNFFSLHFSSGLQQSGRCLLVDSAKVMSSYKWQHHDPSLSSSSPVNETSPATHNTPTARENHLFLIVFSEQGALKAAMALGDRNIVPNIQQSPFSCSRLLFSASFQELETCSRMHVMISTGEWQPFPQDKFLYQIHHLPSKRKVLLISDVCWCQQVSRKKKGYEKSVTFSPKEDVPLRSLQGRISPWVLCWEQIQVAMATLCRLLDMATAQNKFWAEYWFWWC